MKKVIKFKLTNKNIRLRYLAEKKMTGHFDYPLMGDKFGVIPNTAWTWCTLGKHSQVPSDKKCPLCGKSVADAVYKWINDGVLMKSLDKS